ncbi:hypothetical protein KIN20_023355 [Parelaphostrongylus tenuis]|uniref:Uncharacterized protein n=1 Tax=Parelaphostrongylus tenuis TaxID=148309 RepID=A0AAD5QSW8_PARTN|nr:hypothetical protein KIN20_023355 [Parelaphostrongylus tenuis]
MNWLLVNVEEEKKLLEGIVSRFAMTGRGSACMVIGKCASARTTTITTVVEKFGLAAKLRVISVAQLGSENNAVKLLIDEENIKNCILIIEDADELAARQRQSLLYLLLDEKRESNARQWLVFLMVQHQDFITSLEKRVRSRLPIARIVFQPALNMDDYMAAFGKLLGKERTECSSEWLEFVKDIMTNSAVTAELNYMHSVDSSYALLKRTTSAFLCLYSADKASRPVSELFTEAVGMVMPREHSLEKIIKYLRRIANTVDSRVRVSSDLAVYTELDRLVELGILVADLKANNMTFRRCSLNVHTKTLDKILRDIKLPASIEYWFDTQAAE